VHVGDGLHKLLIERTLQPELLLNFRHSRKTDYSGSDEPDPAFAQ
jgi:hypothetical protein